MTDLSSDNAARIEAIYASLGGAIVDRPFRPGAWDLQFEGGLVVELDGELHFNRYRRLTLEEGWATQLPWQNNYLQFADEFEALCLRVGRLGQRWTNPSCEHFFGVADPRGTFVAVGAPRWKQRALYDAMKDIAAIGNGRWRLARLATLDVVGGISLGDALDGKARVDPDALRDLLERRTT